MVPTTKRKKKKKKKREMSMFSDLDHLTLLSKREEGGEMFDILA